MNSAVWPVGVFTSIDAGLGVHFDVACSLGIPTIQLHAPNAHCRTRERADSFLARLTKAGIQLTAVFGGFEGESYADIPTVAQTVGLVPPETREARLAEMFAISDFARWLDCPVIALHLGFVPHDRHSPMYADVVGATQRLCTYAACHQQNVHLETGQETAEALVQFIVDTGCDNLFVNFDPANMILYGTGQPLDALKLLGDRVRSVHCKDAIWSHQPGVTWGREVPLGSGDVNVLEYLRTLKQIGYRGPLTIEREIPQEPERQRQEIEFAATLLRDLSRQLWT